MKQFFLWLSCLFVFNTSLFGGVAKITALNGSVSIERGTQIILAKLGIILEANDIISTDTNSKAQITFDDSTIITIGKESRFSIDEYLFDSSDNSHAKFNVLSGTIRVMSGKIGKIAPEKFTVKTKTATIGIRGTNFAVNLESDGILSIFCLQGSLSVSDQNNHQASIPAGSFLPFSAQGVMGSIQEFITEDLSALLDKSFYIPDLIEAAATQVPLILHTVQNNLTVPAITKHLRISTIFSYTFDETAPPLIPSEPSGGILNLDEALEQGNSIHPNNLQIEIGLITISNNIAR